MTRPLLHGDRRRLLDALLYQPVALGDGRAQLAVGRAPGFLGRLDGRRWSAIH